MNLGTPARPHAPRPSHPTLSTSFELWCEEHRLRPDDPGIWELFENDTSLRQAG